MWVALCDMHLLCPSTCERCLDILRITTSGPLIQDSGGTENEDLNEITSHM